MKKLSIFRWIVFCSMMIDCGLYCTVEGQEQLVINELLGADETVAHVLSPIEYRELKLDLLLERFDGTQTTFGKWGLARLMAPVALRDQVNQRQVFVKLLLEDEGLFFALQEQLAIIAQTQRDLLALFEVRDQLYSKADQLYYDFPFGQSINNALNKSALGLEASFFMGIGSQLLSIAAVLCLDGVHRELGAWLLSDSDSSLDIVRGLKEGLKAPYLQHSFEQTDYFQTKRNNLQGGCWNSKDYFRIMIYGSFGDRYQFLQDGFQAAPLLLGLPATLGDTSFLKHSSRFTAFLTASLPTIITDLFWARRSASMMRSLYIQYVVIHRMRARLVGAGRCLRSIGRIGKILAPYSAITVPVLPQFSANSNSQDALRTLGLLLSARTFNNTEGHMYSRGKVLHAYRMCKINGRQLLGWLQDVAYLDAYVGIASCCKELQAQGLPFCYAEFAPQNTSSPVLDIENGWLMITAQSSYVCNSLLCDENNPTKIMLTGPNGCGKSCFLKMLGQAAVLAQSFGIVPATRYYGTFMQTINTSICPEEDISTGLSSYMAQKESIERIRGAINQCSGHAPGLFLIDEPYRGTVEAESAQRIIGFCENVSDSTYSIVVLATHVQQPTKVLDTRIFGQHQAQVIAHHDGTFERTFKIIPGCADWWFQNAAQRSAFVDWVSAISLQQKR